MSRPPKRTESSDNTIARPRASLPPVSTVAGPTIDQLSDVERAVRDAHDDLAVDVTMRSAQQDATETLVPCPACSWCPLCAGGHMVSHERRKQWLADHPVDPEPEAA